MDQRQQLKDMDNLKIRSTEKVNPYLDLPLFPNRVFKTHEKTCDKKPWTTMVWKRLTKTISKVLSTK